MKKPCRECIHCEPDIILNKEEYDKCEIAKRWNYCFIQRKASFMDSIIFDMCGKRGRWFKTNKISLEEAIAKKLNRLEQENKKINR